MGEQALRELLNDGLLKFNYFLTDPRGRNVKSYMKIPIATTDNSSQELLKIKLIKHGINVEEYYSVYDTSSIPPYNKLSTLSLQIFKYSSCFVSYYKRYKDQLEMVIQEHIHKGDIKEAEDGCFFITNGSVFSHNYNDIENLLLCNQQRQLCDNSRAMNVEKTTTNSSIQLEKTTASRINVLCETNEKEYEMPHQNLEEEAIGEQHLHTIGGNRFPIYQFQSSVSCI